jgi:hypothetical protein
MAHHPEYPWNPDRGKTALFIQSDFAKDAKHQNVDPIIVVEGSGINYSQTGLTNNMANFTVDNLYQMQTHHQFLAESSINIHCMCTSSDAAEELGFEVAMFVQSLRLIAAEMIQFQHITMPQQSKAQAVARNDWTGKFDSIVSFGYSFALRRRHTPVDKGELLKMIEFYLTHPLDTPMPGDKDAEGNPVNIGNEPGNKGGTNTGGQNGNWGGTGGTNDEANADGIDDGYVTLEMKISKDDIIVGEN